MKRAGFTLIELLVVFAVIAILMALLVPVLQSSRRQARAILCGSNIRELLIGLAAYETENEILPTGFEFSFTPPPGGRPGYMQYDKPGWWWFNYITDYSTKNKGKGTTLLCPSKHLTNPRLERNILCGNYGVNLSVCKSASGRRSRAEFIGTPLRTTDIPHPDQTLLIVDSGYSIINWWHAADIAFGSLGNTRIEDTAYIPGLKINKERNLWPGQEQDAIYGRHTNKTVNVGFADGHVKCIKADDLLVEKIEKTEDDYKNRSPLWRPK